MATGSASTDFYADKKLAILRGTTLTQPTTLYLVLYTTAPTDTASTGTEVTNAGNYARVTVTCNTTNWGAPAAKSGGGRKITNSVAFSFNPATADWGTVVAFGLADSATHNAGNLWLWSYLSTPVSVLSGQTRKFDVGELEIAED